MTKVQSGSSLIYFHVTFSVMLIEHPNVRLTSTRLFSCLPVCGVKLFQVKVTPHLLYCTLILLVAARIIQCRRVICIKLDSECYCHHICNQTLTFPSSPETNLWKRVAECDGTQSVSHGNRSTKSEILVSFSAPCWLNRKFSHLVSAKCVHMLRERQFSEIIWSFPC